MSPGLSPRLYRILLWLYDWTVSSKHLGFQLPSLLIFAQFRAADQAGFVSFWTHINIVPRIVSYHPSISAELSELVCGEHLCGLSFHFICGGVWHCRIFMAALWNRADHYIFVLWFLSSIYLIFFPRLNLSRRRLDVYHTSTHGVALVRIQNAGLKHAARGSLKIQDAKKFPKIAIWVPSHNYVGLYLRN